MNKIATTDPGRYPFSHPIRVRWAEVDMQGVVFNGHYLTWFDIGMTEFLRLVFAQHGEHKDAFFNHLYVVRSTIDYQRPATFDDEVQIRVGIEALGRSSLNLGFAITRGDDVLVSGNSTYVLARDGRSEPIGEPVRSLLSAHLVRDGH